MQISEGVVRRLWPLLRFLASFYRRTGLRKSKIIAVVGSLGKTTTLRSVACAMSIRLHKNSDRNYKSRLAISILRIPKSAPFGVVEAGIDQKGLMRRYARLIQPDVTVITSVASEHHRSLGSLEGTRDEKAEMIRAMSADGCVVLNGDDANVLWMRGHTKAKVFTFGFGRVNDIRAENVCIDWPNGTRFDIIVGTDRHTAQTRFIGRHMVYPILAAVCVAMAESRNISSAIRSLEDLEPTPGRMEPVPLANGAYLLRDDFKSTLESISSALDVLNEIPAPRKIVVLGEVSEPPGSQGPIYRAIGNRLGRIVARAVFVGGNFQRYAAGADACGLTRSCLHDAGRNIKEALKNLSDLGRGDVVLIKGRDTQRLERIALSLMGRSVRCTIPHCDARAVRCDQCPMLEKGWEGHPVII